MCVKVAEVRPVVWCKAFWRYFGQFRDVVRSRVFLSLAMERETRELTR